MNLQKRPLKTEYLELLAEIKDFDPELWLTAEQIQALLQEVLISRHEHTDSKSGNRCQ
jgi:hypothetical protein